MNRWAILVAVAFAALLSVLVVDCAGGTPEATSVEVIDRTYEAPRTWTDVMSDGRGHCTINTHHEPAHWRAIVRDGSGVRAVAVSEGVWACAKPGATLTSSVRIGRWTGARWNECLSVPQQAEQAP